jgi:hypothetical protein
MSSRLLRDPFLCLTGFMLFLAWIFYETKLESVSILLLDFLKIQVSLGFFKVVTEPLATRRFQNLILEIGVIGVKFVDEHFSNIIASCNSEEDVRSMVACYLRDRTDVAWDRFAVGKEKAVEMGVDKCMEIWRIDKFIGKAAKES